MLTAAAPVNRIDNRASNSSELPIHRDEQPLHEEGVRLAAFLHLLDKEAELSAHPKNRAMNLIGRCEQRELLHRRFRRYSRRLLRNSSELCETLLFECLHRLCEEVLLCSQLLKGRHIKRNKNTALLFLKCANLFVLLMELPQRRRKHIPHEPAPVSIAHCKHLCRNV